jgi:hypothetical protein
MIEIAGLTPAQIQALRLHELTPMNIEAEHGILHTLGGYRIPYWEPSGAPTAFFRDRVYWPEALRDHGRRRTPKYLQSAGTQVRAYFPPLQKWPKILADPTRELLLTEGEKKAAIACLHGFPTLGLAGIDSYQSSTQVLDLIPNLEAIAWHHRPVCILYDSDLKENRDGRQTATRLALRLEQRGAKVKLIFLPGGTLGTPKVGLDDFLLAQSSKALRALIEEAPMLNPESPELRDLLDRAVLVKSESRIFLCDPDAFGNLPTFSRLNFQTSYIEKENRAVLTPTGRPQFKPVSLADIWFEHPEMRKANRLALLPDKPPLTVIDGDLNIYKGMGVTPKKGDVRPMMKLLKNLLVRPEELDYLLRWLAYPLQHPGKISAMVFLYGGQGTGKSAVGEVMRDLYGPSATMVRDSDLFNRFNAWLRHTLFVTLDDMDDQYEATRSRATLKRLVDSRVQNVEAKGVDPKNAQVHCNFYFNANDALALPLDAFSNNRRFYVVECIPQRTLPERWYTQTFDAWRKQGGPAAFYHYLLHYPTEGFDPYGDAPETPARLQLSKARGSDAESWLQEPTGFEPHQFFVTDKQLTRTFRRENHDTRRPTNERFLQLATRHLPQRHGYWQIRPHKARTQAQVAKAVADQNPQV